MSSRLQNSISMRFGLFHTWKSKNIFVRQVLRDKYLLNQRESQLRQLILRNVSTKRTARKGFIPALAMARIYLLRRTRTEKPIIKLHSSIHDILVQDTYWKLRWKLRFFIRQMSNAYRILFFILRRKTLQLIKRRLILGLKTYMKCNSHRIGYAISGFSLRYSSANFLSRYFTRKLKLRYNIYETVLPYIRLSKKRFSGLLISCFGRFTRRQRAHKLHFEFGKTLLNSLSASVDYRNGHVPLKYGVCSVKVYATRIKRTLGDTFRYLRRAGYLMDQRNLLRKQKPIRHRFSSSKRFIPSITTTFSSSLKAAKRHFSTQLNKPYVQQYALLKKRWQTSGKAKKGKKNQKQFPKVKKKKKRTLETSQRSILSAC